MTGGKDERAESSKEDVENASRKTINPYDLSSGDNPGALISHVLLKHDNYDEWSRELRTALRSRKKFGFVDGSIKRPAEDSLIMEDWWTNQSLIVSWIRNTIDPSLKHEISHFEIAKELWDDIKEQLSVVNGPRIQQLKGDLITCKQGTMTVSSYYGRLKRLWESLGDYEKSGACTCDGCTCGSKTREARKREDDKVHQFLWGLDEQRFGAVKTSLLSRDPLPTINQVYSTVLRDETMKKTTHEKEHVGEIVSFAVGTTQSRGRGDGMSRDLICSHCGRSGHMKDKCYQLIGYPENWGERGGRNIENRGGNRGRGRGRSFSGPRANMAHGDGEHGVNVAGGFSEEQLKLLQTMFNTGKISTTETLTGKDISVFWILDTGATNHMTSKLEVLTDVRNISPRFIILADGRKRVATKIGTVVLGRCLRLLRVLYVPDLDADLISVSQMNDQNDCFAQFYPHLCVIQDRSLRTIGAGQRIDGLYYFRAVESAAAVRVQSSKEFDVWHKRLGHPSSKIVRLLPHVVFDKDSGFLNKACEICLRAKQTRDCF